MNELIEKLAEQAEQYVKSNPQAGVTIHAGDMFNEKFAELIVRECADHIAHNQHINWLTAANAAKDLKKHFGVEE